MLNTVLQYILSIPFILSSLVSVASILFSIFSVMYGVYTKKYTFINKVNSLFETDSVPYCVWSFSAAGIFATFLLYCLDIIDRSYVLISIGVGLYSSCWYLIYVVDSWYTAYQQYTINKQYSK